VDRLVSLEPVLAWFHAQAPSMPRSHLGDVGRSTVPTIVRSDIADGQGLRMRWTTTNDKSCCGSYIVSPLKPGTVAVLVTGLRGAMDQSTN
jgi:hypothetical protein